MEGAGLAQPFFKGSFKSLELVGFPASIRPDASLVEGEQEHLPVTKQDVGCVQVAVGNSLVVKKPNRPAHVLPGIFCKWLFLQQGA